MTRRGFWIAQLLWWSFYVVVFHLASLPGLADASLHGQLVHLGQKLLKAGAGRVSEQTFHVKLRGLALAVPLSRRHAARLRTFG